MHHAGVKKEPGLRCREIRSEAEAAETGSCSEAGGVETASVQTPQLIDSMTDTRLPLLTEEDSG